MAKAVVSLGSNLGNRFQYIDDMKKALASVGEVKKCSPLYETAPIGVGPEHSAYLNMVVLIEYEGAPVELLEDLQHIEKELGRVDKGGLQPRTADLDILLFEGVTLTSERLTIPHHALFERRFSYEGALSVCPDWRLTPEKTLQEWSVDPQVLKQEMKLVS